MKTLIEEAIGYIYGIPKFNRKSCLDNTRHMLALLDHPEEKMQLIHVAGTNGKGSVCAFISAILQGMGYSVGRFTSPHLIVMNERITVNGADVDDDTFVFAYLKLREISENMMREGYEHPSFFEFLFGMAMLVFADRKVNYAVLECGLGGRLDATNAPTETLISIITSISLDHTDILGDTIDKIAFEKAGIIKKGGKVCYIDRGDPAGKVIMQRAKAQGAEYFALKSGMIRILEGEGWKQPQDYKHIDFCLSNEYYDNVCFSVKMQGDYQAENASLALTALAMCGLIPDDMNKLREFLSVSKWPGRMQEVIPGVIVDGAHNEDAIRRFVENIPHDTKSVLVYSAVSDKHYEVIIPILCQCGRFDDVVIYTINDARGLDVSVMESYFTGCGGVSVHKAEDVIDAMKTAISLANGRNVYCAGSLYMVGEVLDSQDKWNPVRRKMQ